MSGDHNMYQKPRSHVDDDIQYDEAQVQAMIKKAVRDEREACAKVCDAVQKKNEDDGAWMWEARNCAAAIRSRGQQ